MPEEVLRKKALASSIEQSELLIRIYQVMLISVGMDFFRLRNVFICSY